ncbi:hypothetical protein NQZ68_012024 [Dissostichus eleginoides]|nr:hypothetical protein NQZ68_012024 [Dissostichus eleginoides]
MPVCVQANEVAEKGSEFARILHRGDLSLFRAVPSAPYRPEQRRQKITKAVGHSAGLALYQNAAWLSESRTLSLSNGIMGEEGGCKAPMDARQQCYRIKLLRDRGLSLKGIKQLHADPLILEWPKPSNILTPPVRSSGLAVPRASSQTKLREDRHSLKLCLSPDKTTLTGSGGSFSLGSDWSIIEFEGSDQTLGSSPRQLP